MVTDMRVKGLQRFLREIWYKWEEKHIAVENKTAFITLCAEQARYGDNRYPSLIIVETDTENEHLVRAVRIFA